MAPAPLAVTERVAPAEVQLAALVLLRVLAAQAARVVVAAVAARLPAALAVPVEAVTVARIRPSTGLTDLVVVAVRRAAIRATTLRHKV